ncbi:MAG: alpha/beta hydrolase family protein [Planctomycetales bacterium]
MRALILASLIVVFPVIGSADETADLQKLLDQPILAVQQTLTEAQAFCAGRVAPLPQATSADEWVVLAEKIRQETLARTVYRGEAARWRDAELKVEWLETIPGGPGYKIRKLRYEALPGMWIPALLYLPEKLTGKFPVFLNVNGHDAIGKAVDYKQMRCINQAKRGIVNLNPEWFNMGQLRSDGYAHGRLNQLDLCGTSGLAPFYLSMKRGLDVLLSLPDADPTRVGVAGLSGGGWQTIIISSLDTRVTLANPVAGYSSFITRNKNFSDLGDSEQTPVDLATTADYSHLTALMAPRATLLTYNLNDNCCFKADHALPPLLEAGRPFYRLFGKDDHLRYHINAEPGDHNFQKENREALYRMIGRHFFPADKAFHSDEIPSAEELKTPEQLHVEVPQPNADFHSLAAELARSLPRDPELPKTAAAARAWQGECRKQLTQLVKPRPQDVQAEPVDEQAAGDFRLTRWKLKLADGWTIPAVELTHAKAAQKPGTVLLLADGGRGGAAERGSKLAAAGRRVVIMDPFYFGESKLGQRDYLFALLISAVGERPLGVQSGQVISVARWLAEGRKSGPVSLGSTGPRTGLVALVAAALDEKAIADLTLLQPLTSLKEAITQNRSVEQVPEQFCFGLLEWFDVKQIAALVAPRQVSSPDAHERLSKEDLEELAAYYRLVRENSSSK